MRKEYNYTRTVEKKLTAIVIVQAGAQVEGKKYLHIDNTHAGVSTFIAFAKNKFPAAVCVNLYCPKTGRFVEKIHLQ